MPPKASTILTGTAAVGMLVVSYQAGTPTSSSQTSTSPSPSPSPIPIRPPSHPHPFHQKLTPPSHNADLLPNPFHTTAVSSIEDRYSSGGATDTHTPGAATPTGNSRDMNPRTDKQQGIGTEGFKEKIAGQRPDPSAFDKAWNKAHYGAEKGK
ncbi:MAG: hypothetical protein M1836_007051 [Candelina mexicana]|nr:MAG: hypothetical protein M1836_007051 [Candelina mexicana]